MIKPDKVQDNGCIEIIKKVIKGFNVIKQKVSKYFFDIFVNKVITPNKKTVVFINLINRIESNGLSLTKNPLKM